MAAEARAIALPSAGNETADTMLAVADVQVRRGDSLALDVAELTVSRGETLAVMGPNGAGKSTLLLVLALLQPPTRGQILIGGEVATGASALRLRRRMAVVFQEPLLLAGSVADNVATGLRLRGVPGAERAPRVARWLDAFGIAHLARRPARALSGGEAQRTSLVRALALEPEVLFLDEPFSALDAPTRASVTADLQRILRETRTTTVIVTHDRDEALAFGDRVGVLVGGELRQIGPPEDVFAAPADADVAGFVGVETLAPGVVVGQDDGLATVRVAERLVEVASHLAVGAPVYLCLRPEDVTLYPVAAGGVEPPDGRASGSARNRLVGVVAEVAPSRGQVRAAVECGLPLAALVTRRSAAEMGLAPGVRVEASFKATAAHLIARADGRT